MQIPKGYRIFNIDSNKIYGRTREQGRLCSPVSFWTMSMKRGTPPPPQTHYSNDIHYGLPVLGSWVPRTHNWPCNKQQHMYARQCLPTWCSGAPAWACTAKLALSAFDIYDTISAVSPHKISAQTKHTIINTYI